MGDVSVMTRRLSDGSVQYGWSGNGGYYQNTGIRLISWYNDPEKVDYLFGLGQTRRIGKPGSENGNGVWYDSHELIGDPFWQGTSERQIFSKIAFVDYSYFYDTDNKWYYVIPGPFRIKIPFEFITDYLKGTSKNQLIRHLKHIFTPSSLSKKLKIHKVFLRFSSSESAVNLCLI